MLYGRFFVPRAGSCRPASRYTGWFQAAAGTPNSTATELGTLPELRAEKQASPIRPKTAACAAEPVGAV